MPRAGEYTCAVFLLSMLASVSAWSLPQGNPPARSSPLAYVRVIGLSPVLLTWRQAQSPASPKMAVAEEELGDLAELAARTVAQVLRERLEATGTRTIALRSALSAVLAGPDHEAALIDEAAQAGADGVIVVEMDRFGIRDTVFRELWVRLSARVVHTRTRSRSETLEALSIVRTAPRVVRRGFMRSNVHLAEEAAKNAAHDLYRALHTGYQRPVASEIRVAVLPALVPETVPVTNPPSLEARYLPVPILARQADVLFQPDLGPLATLVPRQHVSMAMKQQGIAPRDLWDDITPRLELIIRAGKALNADVAVAHRVTKATITHLKETGSGGSLAEAEVSCLAIRVSDGSVFWSLSAKGTARTSLALNGKEQMIRSPVQAVWDAVLAAYGRARISLEECIRGQRKESL